MRIFLTGATGFIGSYLLRKLLFERHEVMILLREGSNLWRIDDVVSRTRIIYGDYKRLHDCENSILEFDPELVFHLGWLGVGNQERNSISQLTDNASFTLALSIILLKSNVRSVIGIGSQAEYGPYNRVIHEAFPTNPTTLYGISKLNAYHLFKYNLNSKKIRFAWLRLFSSYGPKDNNNWLIPYLITSLAKGERPALTKAEQLWDYIYIDDVVNAIYAVGLTESASGVFNLGSGIGYSLKKIVTMIRDLVNPDISLGFGEVSYRPDQVMVLQADNTRLILETNWSPDVTLEQGLQNTINWFLENKHD